MLETFLDLVSQYDRIIIFRHIDGDGDALGSQWGLYTYLKDKYADKEIFCVGDVTLGYQDLFPSPHNLEDSDFHNSLAIVCDTANKERISDQRYALCDKIIKIDHHIPLDSYGTLNIEDDKRSSCGEIVADLLSEIEDKKPLSKESAQFLYLAIISDTQGFSISSVTSKTFESASYLLESGINPAELSDSLRQIDLNLFQFQASLYEDIKYLDNRIASLLITQKKLKEHNLTTSEVKLFVNLMRNIKGVSMWVLFLEQEDGTYSASLRSKNIDINQVARKFNGGGHLFASGVKNLTEDTMQELLKELNKL